MRYILTESQYKNLQEIDWEGEFSDVNASCLRADYVVQMLNNEIDRIAVVKSLGSKGGKSRGKMDVYHPVYSKASKERLSSVDDSGELGIDVNKYISAITSAPKSIFDINSKMERSDMGGLQLVVNTGLPALVAIVYDMDKSKFYMINTCPSAGTCKNYCYARKGQYGMNDGKILKALQRLNMLMNDPEEYYHMVMDELEPYALKVKRQARRSGEDMKLVIRWNDSGDFFAKKYFEIAKRATDELIQSGYPVKSYAYTKMAKYYNLADDNFVMNFSTDAKKSEISQLDLDNSKYSQVVQKLDVDENPIFMDLFAVGEDPKTGRTTSSLGIN